MEVLFDGWKGILQIAITAPLIYVSVILYIRVAGKRSTSQMNNFDWVVTVALGSLAASGMILEDVSAAEALFAIGLLVFIQWVLTNIIYHNKTVAGWVKAQPAILVDRGSYKTGIMRKERVTEAEVNAAIRENGITDINKVQWVILETDATLSVIPVPPDDEFETSTVQGVKGLPDEFKT